MRTQRQTWPAISGFDGLLGGYYRARRTHLKDASHLEFAANLTGNLLELVDQLANRTYLTGPYRRFTVREPKPREVAALPFKDRVVQHSLCNAIEPFLDARMIQDSYACRVGGGTQHGIRRVQAMLRACQERYGKVYVLQGDVRSYFASIDHATLKCIYRRRLADHETLWLLEEIIDSTPGPKGLPIGNLTSQLSANIYLDALDQHVKQDLRERWYGRYMDDWIIVHPDKAHLHGLRSHLGQWLGQRLQLQLNHKTQVRPVSDTQLIKWLGYRIGPNRRSIAKTTLRRWHAAQRAARSGTLRRDPASIAASYQGLFAFESPRRRPTAHLEGDQNGC